MKPERICQLLDKAKEVTGSDYRTAQLIKAPRQRLPAWRAGRTPMPVADIVLVAEICGLDPVAWCARAVQENHEGTPKGDALAKALKKCWPATGVVTVLFGVGTDDALLRYFIQCAKCYVPNLVTEHELYRQAIGRFPTGPGSIASQLSQDSD